MKGSAVGKSAGQAFRKSKQGQTWGSFKDVFLCLHGLVKVKNGELKKRELLFSSKEAEMEGQRI